METDPIEDSKKFLESQNVWRIKEFKQDQTVADVTNLAIGAQESKSKGGLESGKWRPRIEEKI